MQVNILLLAVVIPIYLVGFFVALSFLAWREGKACCDCDPFDAAMGAMFWPALLVLLPAFLFFRVITYCGIKLYNCCYNAGRSRYGQR